MPFPNAQEFDVSNVTLKELRDVLAIVKQEIDQTPPQKTLSPEMKQRYEDLKMYWAFLQNSIQTKTIDELNKQYFGGKISLKNKLLEAEEPAAEKPPACFYSCGAFQTLPAKAIKEAEKQAAKEAKEAAKALKEAEKQAAKEAKEADKQAAKEAKSKATKTAKKIANQCVEKLVAIQEEEEELPVFRFTYEGKTYLREVNGDTVYDYDTHEDIGTWDGVKIHRWLPGYYRGGKL